MIEIKNEKYYTPLEVAKKFDVTIGSIAKWRQSGKLIAHKINNRRFMFSETSIERLLKSCLK